MKTASTRPAITTTGVTSFPAPPSGGCLGATFGSMANTIGGLEDTLAAMHNKLGLGSGGGEATGPDKPQQVGLLSDASELESRLNAVLSSAVFINSAL